MFRGGSIDLNDTADHENRPLPSCVNRAVRYLRDNLNRVITLDELVRAADAPSRTLHRQFRQSLGMTPWAYVRILRLAAARRALSTPGRPAITDIALSVGYTHLSRFARDYRVCYGELPSVTRQRKPAHVLQQIHIPNRPHLVIARFQATAVQENQIAHAMSEHLAAELTRSGLATVGLLTSAIGHRPITDRQYRLVGRLIRAAGQLRVTVRLINDETGFNVWAGNFDGCDDEPFAMQDRVAHGVVSGLGPALFSAEIDRLLKCPGSTLAAREIALRAIPLAMASDPDSARRLLAATEQALSLDPADTLSLSLASLGHAQTANFLNTTAPSEHREQAVRLSRRAAASDGQDALSLTALASTATSLGNPLQDAVDLTVRALTMNPTLGWAWCRMGFLRLGHGQEPECALADFHRALRFTSPTLPHVLILNGFSRVSLAAGSRADNIAYSMRALAENPRAAWIQVNLICAYQAAGEFAAMRRSLYELRTACPDLTVGLFADCRPYLPAQCLQIMRDAGLPLN